jgi:hypothetical protein
MRVLISLTVCVATAFLLLMLCTAFGYLSNDIDVPKSLVADWNAGRIHKLALSSEFWQRYPTLPAGSELVHLPTMIFTGLLLAVVLFNVGFKTRLSPLSLALISLLIGLAPYAVARWALADPTLKADQAARWLPVMLTGVFYATAVSFVLAVLDFLECSLKSIWFRLTHPRAKLHGKPA